MSKGRSKKPKHKMSNATLTACGKRLQLDWSAWTRSDRCKSCETIERARAGREAAAAALAKEPRRPYVRPQAAKPVLPAKGARFAALVRLSQEAMA